MENDFWLNLSSNDLTKAREFFVKLGFITDTIQSNEVLFSIGASSPSEVDAMAKKAKVTPAPYGGESIGQERGVA